MWPLGRCPRGTLNSFDLVVVRLALGGFRTLAMGIVVTMTVRTAPLASWSKSSGCSSPTRNTATVSEMEIPYAALVE